MNIYTTKFMARCPNNGIRIEYQVRIETRDVLRVEEIVEGVDLIDEGFHEEIADQLLARFGGSQMLIAHHHGVMIETHRAGKASS